MNTLKFSCSIINKERVSPTKDRRINKIKSTKDKATINNSGYYYTKDKNKICVYFHYYNDEKYPFYIGEGTLSRAYRFSSRNNEWKDKVEDISLVRVVIYKFDISKEEAIIIEEDLIKKYRKYNCLVNISNGVGAKDLHKNNKNCISIVELDINDNFICEYSSAKEAANIYNICSSTITKCCKGIKKSYYNKHWKYSKDYYND